MIRAIGKYFVVVCLCFFHLSAFGEPIIDISCDTALRIGVKIWYNECNGKISGLTSWNEGEKFASLGIGHFNWYPANQLGSPKDGFPQLIKYMERRGVTIPTWLQGENVPPCPWNSRQEFLAAQQSPKMQELREFLVNTIPYQAQFMAVRLVDAFPKLITSTPYEDREYVFRQFKNLSSTPRGLYALVDYVNFKGEGTSAGINHHGGWGLLQVVRGMRCAPCSMDTMQAFVWSANQALTFRAERPAATYHEHKWLPGWRKRICTYLD